MKKITVQYLLAIICCLFLLFSNPLSAQTYPTEWDFRKADNVAMLYPKHSLSDLKLLSEKLTQPFTTEHEKFRAIYKWVCENIENHYSFYAQNKRKREKLKDNPEALKQWNKELGRKVRTHLISKYETVCTGYAYLLKDMALYSGIECEIVNGYGRNIQHNIGDKAVPNHSWNAVKLDGKWYLCDATWASGSINLTARTFMKNYSEGYFLSPPEIFVRSHYPLDRAWFLLDNPPVLTEFLNGPLVYKGAFNNQFNPTAPQTFNLAVRKGEIVTFSFTKLDGKPIKNFQIESNWGSQKIHHSPDLTETAPNQYSFVHTFNRKGVCVLNLMIGDEYVATYRVKAQKK